MNHDDMFFSQERFELLSCKKNKISAIIATSQAPIKTLAWSILSLFFRSKDYIENIHVLINGPSEDCKLQDDKQSFLNKLKSAGIPITIHRVYGSIGHSQAIDSVVPWIKTEFYLTMHDDLIVLDDFWTDNFDKMKTNSSILYDPPLLMRGLEMSRHKGKLKLAMPHLNTTFMICRNSAFKEAGATWGGYHVTYKFNLSKCSKILKFINHHIANNHIRYDYRGFIPEDFDYVNVDIGGWAYYLLSKHGFEFEPIKTRSIFHIRAASWYEVTEKRFSQIDPLVQDLEYEIEKEKEVFRIYCEFKDV
jgi:hypothetical protein